MIQNIFSVFISDNWEQAVHRLAIKEGTEEAKQGRPTTDTPRYSVGETAVRNKVEAQLGNIQKRLADEVQKVLPTVTRRISEVQQAEVSFESRQTIDVIRSSLSADFESKRSSLEDAFYRKHKSEGTYNAFRNTHGVTIDPDHPVDPINYLSFVFLMLTAETVLNALFWQQGLEGDLTKGLLIAAAIAGANIVVGFVGGLVLAYKNLNSTQSKILGWVGFTVSIFFVVAINWQVLEIRREQVGIDQVSNLINSLVFLLGFGFALFSSYKGYSFRGSFPGYREASDSFIKACKDLKTEEDSLRTSVVTEIKSQEDVRNLAIRKVSDVLTAYTKTKGELQALDLSFRTSVSHLNNVLENVVGAYRKTNVATKGAAIPSPTWFNDSVEKFENQSQVLDGALTDLFSALAHAESTLETMRSYAKSEISQLSELRSEFTGEKLTALKLETDARGLARFLDTLSSDIGNQGINKTNYK